MDKKFLAVLATVAAWCLLSSPALAANISFPVDTAVSFSGGDTVTALGGSTADAFTVSTASATVTVSAGISSSTFRSILKAFVIDSDTATATSCTGSGDILTVTGTGTTTFSLASSGCTGGTAFRSITASGSGGSPRSPVSGPISGTSSSTSTAPSGSVAGVPPRVPSGFGSASCLVPTIRTSKISVRFGVDLQFGMRRSDEVRRLQEFLIEEGIYPEALVTGNYLSLTRAAVERYHLKYCIARPGDRGYGRFGPASRTTASRILGF